MAAPIMCAANIQPYTIPTLCRPNTVGHERDGRRDRRDVVESEEDANTPIDIVSWIERQEQQADPAEAVVDRAGACAGRIGRSGSRSDRPDEVEDAHDARGRRPRWRRETVVDRMGDEVLADEAVRGRAADEERAREEPEVGRSWTARRMTPRIRAVARARSAPPPRRAARSADVGRVVAQPEERPGRRRTSDEHRQDDRRRPPADGRTEARSGSGRRAAARRCCSRRRCR